MCVCVCVCVCVCIYIYMCVYVYMCMCICVCHPDFSAYLLCVVKIRSFPFKCGFNLTKKKKKCGSRLSKHSLTLFCAAGDRAEGAEGHLDNAPAATSNNNNNGSTSSSRKSFSLEARFSFLNLRRPRTDSAKNTDNCLQKAEAAQTVVLVK